MARSRNLKPSFFDNDELAHGNCPLGRLLFAGMWTIADFNGNLEYRPAKIKKQLLAYDECDIDSLVTNLDKSGFIRIYHDSEKTYLHIINFVKHQNPHPNEKKKGTDIPEYEEYMRQAVDSKDIVINHDKSRLNRNNSLTDPASSFIPLTDSFIPPPRKKDSGSDTFEQVWALYPKRPGANKKDSLKAYNARIKAGASPDEILAGVVRYARFVAASRTEPQYIKQPATFFGPGEHYKSDWALPKGSTFLSDLTGGSDDNIIDV